MTDAPDKISISPVYNQKRDDDFYLVDRKAFPGKGTEYTRTDLYDAKVAEVAALKDDVERMRDALEGLIGPDWQEAWEEE